MAEFENPPQNIIPAPGEKNYDELSLKLKENTDYDVTILDVKATPGVLEAMQPHVNNPRPEYHLYYLLKVTPDLLDTVLQTLTPHPGIEYISKVGARYLGYRLPSVFRS